MDDERLTHKVAHAILHTAQAGEGSYQAMAAAAVAVVRAEDDKAADPLLGVDPQQFRNRAEMARQANRHEDSRVMIEALNAVGTMRRRIDTLRAEIERIRDVASTCFVPASSPRHWMETCADTMERALDGETAGHRPFTDDGVTYCGLDGKGGCGELWPCSTVRAKAESIPEITGTVCSNCGSSVDLDELAQRYIRRRARAANAVPVPVDLVRRVLGWLGYAQSAVWESAQSPKGETDPDLEADVETLADLLPRERDGR